MLSKNGALLMVCIVEVEGWGRGSATDAFLSFDHDKDGGPFWVPAP